MPFLFLHIAMSPGVPCVIMHNQGEAALSALIHANKTKRKEGKRRGKGTTENTCTQNKG